MINGTTRSYTCPNKDEIYTYETNNIIQILKNRNIRITSKQFPKKVLYCECKYCETCTDCNDAINSVIYENKIN